MTPLPDYCTFYMDPTRQCGRGPISADYIAHDAVKGDQHVSSLCAMHDGPAARRAAMAKNIERRSRKPELELVG